MPIIRDQHMDIVKLRLGRNEDIQRDLRVHKDSIAIMPEQPFQALGFGFREFLPDDGHDPAVFRPEAPDHVFAEDEVWVALEFVVEVV